MFIMQIHDKYMQIHLIFQLEKNIKNKSDLLDFLLPKANLMPMLLYHLGAPTICTVLHTVGDRVTRLDWSPNQQDSTSI